MCNSQGACNCTAGYLPPNCQNRARGLPLLPEEKGKYLKFWTWASPLKHKLHFAANKEPNCHENIKLLLSKNGNQVPPQREVSSYRTSWLKLCSIISVWYHCRYPSESFQSSSLTLELILRQHLACFRHLLVCLRLHRYKNNKSLLWVCNLNEKHKFGIYSSCCFRHWGYRGSKRKSWSFEIMRVSTPGTDEWQN